MSSLTKPAPKPNDLLLLLDDDANYLRRVDRTMQNRGFKTVCASSIAEAKELVASKNITHALLDLRLADGNGLDIVDVLHHKNPNARIVMLTGYGAIATAVAAVKMGAIVYLSKPSCDVDEMYNTLMNIESDTPVPPENPMSADRVRWEHIQRVYEMCDRNVSETARKLNMHRRTLQRILAKRAPND